MIDPYLVKSLLWATDEKLKTLNDTLKEVLKIHYLNTDDDTVENIKERISILKIKKHTLKHVLSLDDKVGISQLGKI